MTAHVIKMLHSNNSNATMFFNDARQAFSTSINIMTIFYNANYQKALGSPTFVLTFLYVSWEGILIPDITLCG